MATNTTIAHDATAANHESIRFGLNGVHGDIVGAHLLQSVLQNSGGEFTEKKKMILDVTYGSSFNLRKDIDCQILSRFQRPSGPLPSSMLGLEALTGDLDNFGFEDYLDLPQHSETSRPVDMHHGMEVRLGLSKGPAFPSLI